MKNPDKIKINTPKNKQRPQHFEARKIEKIAQQIGELNFKILYPNGKEQFYEDKVRTGHSMRKPQHYQLMKKEKPKRPYLLKSP